MRIQRIDMSRRMSLAVVYGGLVYVASSRSSLVQDMTVAGQLGPSREELSSCWQKHGRAKKRHCLYQFGSPRLMRTRVRCQISRTSQIAANL